MENAKITLTKGTGQRPWNVQLHVNNRHEEGYSCASLAGAFAVIACLTAGIKTPDYYFDIRG